MVNFFLPLTYSFFKANYLIKLDLQKKCAMISFECRNTENQTELQKKPAFSKLNRFNKS